MPKDELCYQLNHPEEETPCFVEGGRVACSNEDCPVYDAMRDSALIHSFSPADRQSFIECNLLHYTCRASRNSKDNTEFMERLRLKGN